MLIGCGSSLPRLVACLLAAGVISALPFGSSRALIITEIMYHSQEADDRPYEYFEIYNENADPLDLSGFAICNGPDFEFAPGTWIDGKSFLVICANEANIQAKHQITNTVGDWFTNPATSPSLGNGGERISICNPGGKVVTSVRYNDRGKWESGADGTGHSLEIESAYKEVDDPDSWDLSNSIGGSPGQPNPCWPEDDSTTPPGGGGPVGSFTEHTDVGFPCGPGDTTFASGTGRYTITGSGNDIWQGGDQFHYAFVKVNGDFEMKAHIVSRTWGPSQWGKGGIMARQDLTASSRYIFVHDNPDPDGARLAVRPTHGGSDNAEPATLAGGTHPSWYRLHRIGNTIRGYHSNNGTAWTEFDDGAGTLLPFNWTGGSTVYLGLVLTSHAGCNTATLVWDQLTISGTILPPDPGPGPGPDPPPCVARIAVRINEAYLRVDPGDEPWVELHNRGSTSQSLNGHYLTDDPADLTKYAVPNGTSVAAGGYISFTEAQLGFTLAVSTPGEQKFLALVEPGPGNRVVDAYVFEPEFQGYSEARVPNDDRTFSDGADPTQNGPNVVSVNADVVINEVMYHTIDNDNRKEYIELYNKGAVAQDLTGWSLSDGINLSIPPGTVISTGGYLVIARDPSLFTGTGSIYNLPSSIVLGPEQSPEALAAFGGLRNSGERVTLTDPLGRTVDTVRYHDGGEWPKWADGSGSSLELIDASQDNRLGQAWDASDDSSKSTAQTFGYAAVHGNRDTEFTLTLMDRGITLVDDVSVTSGGSITDTPLINSGETWKYLKGTSAPAANWNAPGFNEGGMLSGATGIGYDDGDDTTVLTDMQNSYMTIFCRKTFNVANPGSIQQLILSVSIDDGFYAYLNGMPVGDYNVTSPAFDAAAPSAIEATLVELDITAHKGLLAAGTNLLAIQVHNAGIGSTDLSFNPRLLSRAVTAGTTEHLANGTFNTNTTGWVIEGTHIRSGRTTQSPISGAGSLKIISSAGGDNKVNRIETPNGTTGMTNISAGQTATISLRARWLVGAQTLLTNGYDHEMARAHTLAVPLNLGTPGARNQVTQRLITQSGSSNLGPVITDVEQDPAVPSASDAVTVMARVLDANGVSTVTLRYSLNNPSAAPTSINMTRVSGTDTWTATIPAQAQGTKVVFFIAATDAAGKTGRYPVDITTRTHPHLLNPPAAGVNDHRYCIYRHDVKSPATNYANYRFWMTDASQTELSNRRRLSNDPIDGSFVFGGSTIYHQSKTRFSGSPWARAGWGGSFRVRMPEDNPLHGRIRRFGVEDHHGNGVDARERISHYLIRQQNGGGTDVPYSDVFILVRWQVNDATSGIREHLWVPNGDFVSFWFPDDDEGDFLEMDDRFLINDNGDRQDSDDGRVLHPPPYRLGTNDSNGLNRENYRWFFNLRAKEGADEYANFMAFAKVMDPADTPDATFDQQIWDYANVEELLRLWAVEMNISDWDSWGMERGKNCYFYRPEASGQWHKISWDLELTYETGRLDQFLIPTTATDTFNAGSFGEVNRMLNRPKIKRMYYGILDEMVNGPGRWFHSSYLSDYADRLAELGMANAGIALPGGYIDQRASRLQTRIQGVVYPQVRVAITTSGGANFSTAQVRVNIAGTAPVEVCEILVTNNGGEGTLYTPVYTSMTAWSIAGIPLVPGANALAFTGLDLRGNPVETDTITVTSTSAWQAPVITSLNPSSASVGEDIEVLGTDFHNGLRVFFAAVQSASVQYDENGPTPGKIVARVPAGTGTVNVTVRNADNQTSNARSFTYEAAAPMFIRGDANDDGVVDLSDALKILFHLFAGAATNCQDALDTDDTEALNVTDALRVLNYLFKGGAAPAAPFPAVGTDPSGATLGCSR